MKTPKLRFKTIEIADIPGFEHGGFKTPVLHSNLNIIYGPNSSGKSSLSRAIRQLLRPSNEAGDDYSVSGEIFQDEDTLNINYRYGRAKTVLNGEEIALSDPVHKDMEDRYILSLAELFKKEKDLAEQFLKEASGGLDLTKAKEGLKIDDGQTTPRKKITALKNAKKTVADADKAERDIRQKEKQIPEHEEELQAAIQAGIELDLIEKALSYHQALEKKEETKDALAFVDPSGDMDKLRGDELISLDGIKEEINTLKSERDTAEEQKNQAGDRKDNSPLAEGELDAERLSELDEQAREVQRLEDQIRTATLNAENARGRIDTILSDLGAREPDTEKVKDLDLETTNALLQFAVNVSTHQANSAHLKEVERWLNSDVDSKDEEGLRSGIGALTKWQIATQVAALSATSTGEEPPFYKSSAFFLSVAIGLGLAIAGALLDVNLYWALSLPLIQALLAWWEKQRRGNSTKGPSHPDIYKKEYKSIELERQPKAWKQAEVNTVLNQLRTDQAKARLADQKRQRFDKEQARIQKHSADDEKIALEREGWKDRLGFDWNEENDPNIALWMQQLKSLFSAQEELAGAIKEENAAQNNREELLQEMSADFIKFKLEPAENHSGAAAKVESLRTLLQTYKRAESDIKSAERDLDRTGRAISRKEKDLEELFEAAGLDSFEDKEQELKNRISNWEVYKEKRDDDKNAQIELNLALRPIKGTDLEGLSQEELKEEKEALKPLSEKEAELRATIGGIVALIKEAKKDAGTAEKNAEVDQCIERLKESYEANKEAEIGELLVDFVRNQHDETDKAVIVKRAQELFSKFTLNRCELEVDRVDDAASFICVENGTLRRKLNNSELSGGTQVQLLMAARIAFVEQHEKDGIKIPFILDEVLANSDEQRADEIIKAGISMAREGRQIFYLTAQHDEVFKWTSELNKSDLKEDVDYKRVDLAKERGFSEKEQIPAVEYPAPPSDPIPEPGNMGHKEYGETLNLLPIDPKGNVDEVDLWYVIEDPQALYKLRNIGRNRWVQLKNMVRHGQSQQFAKDAPEFKQAEAAAQILDLTLKSNQIGKGKPVTPPALKNCDCLKTSTYLDRVIEMADHLDGEGKLLIEKLKNGEIRGFGKRAELLEQELEQEGYIDTSEELTFEEIRESVLGQVNKKIIEAGVLPVDKVNWLIDRVLGIECP